MSRDEISPSSYAADQAWFSMLLVNDPNTALVGSLRPSRQQSLWAALLRPFQGPAPLPAPEAEEIAGLRRRPTGWVGALLALGVGLASVGLEPVRLAAAEAYAAVQGEQRASATPAVRPAPAPQVANVASSAEPSRGVRAAVALAQAPAVTINSVMPSPEARALAREAASVVLPRTAKAAATAVPARKKPAARLPRAFGRALTGRSPR